jgi:hypothetical protein
VRSVAAQKKRRGKNEKKKKKEKKTDDTMEQHAIQQPPDGDRAPWADLPVEVWDAVVAFCSPYDYRAMAGSWSTLRALVVRRAEAIIVKVRRAMDAAWDAWEASTLERARRDAGPTRFRRRRPLARPRVWVDRMYRYGERHCMDAHRPARFVVPPPALFLAAAFGSTLPDGVIAHAEGPASCVDGVREAGRGLADWTVEMASPRAMMALGPGLSPASSLPTVRGWLPLGPVAALSPWRPDGDGGGYRWIDAEGMPPEVREPLERGSDVYRHFWMVCCDADHRSWGAVVLVRVSPFYEMRWDGPCARPRFLVAR